jgi:putative two-component system response regulator
MTITDPEPVRILVVDDEDIVREPLLEAMSWVGYAADGARSVNEALHLLGQHQYHVLFCDLVMPDSDGFSLMEVVRARYPMLPVVVLTGHATVHLTQKAMRLGAQDFIIKPFSIRELPFIIERNLERVRLESQLREQQTEDLLFQTVQALTAAIEAKDPYTAGHSQQVAQLAVCFTQVLDMSDTDVFVLRLAGVTHDVGKIGIPESVLLKPGQLSANEWEIMKQHPVIGAEIVGQIIDLGYVAKVVRSHHERWDGTGYPDGLKGETIPFLSRILYISDAYDALTADRAYRKGMTHDQAMEIIRAQAGTHFDADLVDILEHRVLQALGPDWRTPGYVMPQLSRTTREAMSIQNPLALTE